MSENWYLAPPDFLGDFDDETRRQFLSLGHRHNYKKGFHIFRSGDPGESVFVMEQGRVKIYKMSDSGKKVILWFSFPGEVFGLAEATRGEHRDVCAQVSIDASVLRIPRQDFFRFLFERPNVALQIIELLSCRLRVLGETVTNLAADDVSSRIVKLLLRFCSRYGQVNPHCKLLEHESKADVCLDIPLTHQEIADMLGTSRQTVSAVFGELKNSGVVRMHQRHIHVEPRRLEQLLLQSIAR